MYIYEQVNRRYIINATLEMIDGVKTSHPKNLHACRCTVTIGSYPLIEHIILGILKLFLKTLKHYNFRVCLLNNMEVVSSIVDVQYRLINPKTGVKLKLLLECILNDITLANILLQCIVI